MHPSRRSEPSCLEDWIIPSVAVETIHVYREYMFPVSQTTNIVSDSLSSSEIYNSKCLKEDQFIFI